MAQEVDVLRATPEAIVELLSTIEIDRQFPACIDLCRTWDLEVIDGWGVPRYSVFFKLVRNEWSANLVHFAEREPYGIKDPRVRALVTAAISSGDSSKAGQLTNPGRVMLEMRRLVAIVQRELRRIHQPTLIVHPRHDDRTSLGNAAYLQATLGGTVETCVLDDSYYVITVDRQRDIVVERTAAFAKRLAETHGGHGRHDCIEIFDLYQPSASSDAS